MIPDVLKKLHLMQHPHVVILGAGASYAATPDGEKNQRKMPLMKDLPHALDLVSILDENQFIEATSDFEVFYDSLNASGNLRLQNLIEEKVVSFFDSVRITDKVTLYDRLVLSLRKKDAIATFNWDPLLVYAYRRNGFLKTLPALLFLHGNVRLGACYDCNQLGWNDDRCLKCKKPMKSVRLLYPVTEKDYSSDPIINEEWRHLEWFLENSYFVTIFGYSAPKTDVDARSRIIDKLSSNRNKNLLQLEIIDPYAEDLTRGNLADVVTDIHYHNSDSFESSWLSRHPRLSCEALFQATMMVSPIIPYPQPSTENLSELQEWAKEFHVSFPDFLQEGQEWQG
jgi:hypothetical protein